MFSRKFIVSSVLEKNSKEYLLENTKEIYKYLLSNHIDSLDLIIKSYLWLFLLVKEDSKEHQPILTVVKSLLFKAIHDNQKPIFISEDFKSWIHIFYNIEPYILSSILNYEDNYDIKLLYDKVFKKKINHIEKAFLLLCRIRNSSTINIASNHLLKFLLPIIEKESYNYKDFEYMVSKQVETKNYKEAVITIHKLFSLVNKETITLKDNESKTMEMVYSAIKDLNKEVYSIKQEYNDLLTALYEPMHQNVCENKNQKVICKEPYKLDNFWEQFNV